MCHWSKTKFADVLSRLQSIRASGVGDPQIDALSEIVDDITRQVAGELQDLDARVQHLEQHLRTTGPARQ